MGYEMKIEDTNNLIGYNWKIQEQDCKRKQLK